MSAHDDNREHGPWREDLAGYVLGALSEPEAERLEAHLADCERCRAELRWLGSAVDVIAAGVEPRQPPPGLRRRLMATVRAEGAGSAAGGTRWPGFVTGFRPALAAAAVAAVLGAGMLGYVLRGGGEEPITVAVEATDAGPAGVEGELVSGEGGAMLSVGGLPRLSRSDVYQAWVRSGEHIDPSTTFVLDRGGDGVAAIPERLDNADEVMVTREPRGGSARPSTAPLLRVQLG
jgi:anti-sigma-K factor RskA